MRVGILGPVEVTEGGAVVEVGGARLRTLLARLALAAGRVVTVEQLADALWPQERPADEVSAVRSLVSRLRRVLPEPATLGSATGGYRLDLPPDDVDATRFDRLARAGRLALGRGDAAEADRLLTDALALWRGPALAELAGTPLAAHATGLEEARLAAIEDRAEARLARSRTAHLAAELAELAATHPLRERMQALLVRVLAAEGRQAEALATYQRVRERLADELGADPGPELRDAHLAVLRAEPDRAAPTERHPPPAGNVRVPLTSFVGRDADVRRVADLLRSHRLVTLVGPGGAGKTRLATTVAAAAAEQPAGGAWLVELAPVTDPADVPQAVLDAVGQRAPGPIEAQQPPRDTLDRIAESLSRGEVLLVLDNCEHLIDAAALLAEDLLGRCPRLRVLATSREQLGILGEALHPVLPLELPAVGASVATASASPAVRLLAERAAAVRPEFAVTNETVRPVVEICRALDGLPLAIELAAARMRSLTVRQLADRLDDRFRLLGGGRTAMPRHQTLSAVVAWSWELLDPAERRFAERLAVFPAGVGVDAAGHVCGQPDAALDLLMALADKSLLQAVGDTEPRFRMLETVREYALGRLAEADELAEARAAHAEYFRDLAEAAEPHLRGERQLSWLTRLETERANLVAAVHYAAEAVDADTAVRLAAALGQFWLIRGSKGEQASWLRMALDVPGAAPEERRLIATAMYLLNTAFSGDVTRAEQLVAELEPLVAASDSMPDHPLLALVEPALAAFTDDYDAGLAAIHKRLSHPDPWTRAALRMMRYALLENDGDIDGGRQDLVDAVAGFRETGDRWGLAQTLMMLANTHQLFGELDAAIAALEESIALERELDPNGDAGHQRVLLASIRAEAGDVARGRAELRELAATTAGELSPRHVAFAHLALGDLARQDGDRTEAGRQYEQAESVLAEMPMVVPQFHALLLRARAHLAVDEGGLVRARQCVAQGAELACAASDMPVLAQLGLAAAALREGEGDPAGAAELLGATERLRGAPTRSDVDAALLARRLRDDLGDAGYDAACDRGRAMGRAATVAAIRNP